MAVFSYVAGIVEANEVASGDPPEWQEGGKPQEDVNLRTHSLT